jgi:hypothetical protein
MAHNHFLSLSLTPQNTPSRLYEVLLRARSLWSGREMHTYGIEQMTNANATPRAPPLSRFSKSLFRVVASFPIYGTHYFSARGEILYLPTLRTLP